MKRISPNKINDDKGPEVSVILSVYNGGEFLKESVRSVLEQDFKDFELLIMDDCSTDDSLKFLLSIKDPRVKIYQQEKNRGLFPCLNELIARISSDSSLLKLWSQDDIMNADCLSTIVEFHKKYEHIGFSYSDRSTIDAGGNLITADYLDNTPELISPELHARIAFYTGSIAGNIANVCISIEALEKVGLFHEEMKIAADFDMWSRLAREHDTGYINKKLVQLREHVGQLSRKKEYFVRVPKEDMEVYNYMLSYVSPEVKAEGMENLRNYKFVFYYTLMVKSFVRFKFRTSFLFFKHLYSFGHFSDLTLAFIKSKIKRPAQPSFIQRTSLK